MGRVRKASKMRCVLLLIALVVCATALSPQPPRVRRSNHRRGEGYQPPPTMDGNGHGQINFRGGSGTLMRRAVERTNMPITNVIEDGLPNARVASNIVSPDVEELKHPDGFSAAVWWIGQFLDHDLTFNKDVGADIFIDVTGDSHFDPSGEGDFISIRRGDFLFDHTGTRQFVNDITAFLDLSAVYGSRNYRAQFIREYSGGRLAFQNPANGDGHIPPRNFNGLPNLGGDSDDTKFLVGDFRGSENTFLTAAHTLFLRNHNYWADAWENEHPDWDDERLFYAARRWNIAEWQKVIYYEYLPTLLGEDAIPEARGFDPDVDPSIMAEFAGAGWRVGHTFLNNHINLRDPATFQEVGTLDLRDAFQDTDEVNNHGIGRVVAGIVKTVCHAVDARIVEDVRQHLFLGPGFSVNLDLAAMNILRGREMGLPSLNDLREHYGMPRLASFADLTSDVQMQANFAQIFTSIDQVDLWLGLLQEDHEQGSTFGRTLHRLIVDQYTALRDGDLYYFEYDPSLSRDDRDEIKSVTLADIIARNTNIDRDQLQDNVFVV